MLTAKFGWEPDRAEEAIGQLVRLAEIVEPQETVIEIDADPADNRVLEAAAEGQAHTILSGDQHLLTLRTWRGVAIQSPAAFLETIGG